MKEDVSLRRLRTDKPVRAIHLPPSQQRAVLEHFKRRHTYTHTPEHVKRETAAHVYTLPKMSDKEWLRRIWVWRGKDGKIDKRRKYWVEEL